MKAVDKLNIEEDTNFLHMQHVIESLTRSIADQAELSEFVHMIETIIKIVRTQRQIMSEFGRIYSWEL